jgi:D-alanyl-lipoteichoic acid acyltransferase DltB (MBOAT superfamily)
MLASLFSRIGIWWLLIASYYFYCCWDWRLSLLILFSTIINYIAGQRIFASDSRTVRKRWMMLCLAVNLGFLGYFKYCNFFLLNFKILTDLFGLNLSVTTLQVVLPVGISFYTFQTLSYVLDIYKGTLKPTNDFAKFALFVAFFPALVAGPIVRAHDFLPQLEQDPKYDDTEAVSGFYQILSGLFKKVMIADVLAATLVDPAFRNPEIFSGFWLLLAVYAYGMQIYCDFSAYSDIAIGSARVLGYKLPINFDRPYMATSLTDFWRRWHISLSTWLRDYLYIPLGGSRFGTFNTYRNLFITMLLGGLWHGAAWNFVIWGGLHGLWLAVERLVFGGKRLLNLEGQSKPFIFFRWLLTFHVVIICWIFFRAQATETLSAAGSAWTVISRIVIGADGISGFSWWFVLILISGYMMHFTPVGWKNYLMVRYAKTNVFLQAAIAVVMLSIYTFFSTGSAAFIYFQF